MKKLRFHSALVALSLAVLVATMGCQTPGTTIPPTVKDKAEKSAIVLKSTARSAVYYAYSKETNVVSYVDLAIVAVNQFVTTEDLSPGALSRALQGLPIKELKSVEAQLAINTLELAYELFWSEYVKGVVKNNEVVLIVLTGLRDGLVLGRADVRASAGLPASPPPTQ